MSVNPEVFMTWTARDFYHMVRFHAWESQAEREYSKLMGNKIK